MAKLLVVTVVLGIPSSTLALILRSSVILDAMEANKLTFTTPTPAITVARGHVVDLQTAENSVQTRTKGTAGARDDKKKIVIADMHQLHAYVQQLANASPEHADAIAQAAAMRLRNKPAVHKSDLTVKHVVSGTVKLTAKAAKGSRAHEWEYSTDGGKTWTAAPASLAAHTTIPGLQTGVLTYFRHRHITKAGPEDWGQSISALVS
jgi:hypothetical protein